MLKKPVAQTGLSPRAAGAFTVLAACAIFVADTFTPLDMAIAVLYAVVVVISASFLNRRGILSVGLLCMMLALASYVIVHGFSDRSGPVVRLFVSLFAIGLTTVLALANQKAILALQEQATLLDLTHDAISVRDWDDRFTYWNAGSEKLYGWTSAEALGRRPTELLRTRYPVDGDAIRKSLLDHGHWQGELVQTKRDGSLVTVISRCALQRDQHGKPIAIMATNNDVTEQKQAEDALHLAQAELSHVARVSTLGELTASIAHEVNQPLAAVVTNGEASLRWLRRDVPDLQEVRSSVERMISSGRRASEVVARLRALARKNQTPRSVFALNDIVDDVLPLVEREIQRHDVALSLALDPALPPISGDRVQMQQVVINLIVNAVQAMATVDATRHLHIRTCTDQVDESPPSAMMEITDTGPGLPPETSARLFSAFFTTKANGMGMGLSICRTIVEAHGGRINAAPAQPRGAQFSINLPIHEEA